MGDQISRIFGRFSLIFNIVHGKLAAFLIFPRNFETLAEGDGKDIRIRDRSGAPALIVGASEWFECPHDPARTQRR